MKSRPAKRIVSTDRLLWTAGVVAGSSLPHWLTVPIWVPGLLCLSLGWRLAAALWGWPLPNAFVRISLAFLAFTAVLAQFHTINGVEAGSALLVVMVALKFLESHTYRDQLVLMIIAYFLVFASLLYDRGLFIIAYLLAFVWFTTVGLLQLGRRGALLSNTVNMKLAARLLLQSLPVMLVLFLLFPRLPGPLWAIPGTNVSGRTGLSDTMSPGDLTELGLSDDVAFRVDFFQRPPGPDELYWRGPVLSNFNGRTWSSDGPWMRGRMLETIEFHGEPIQYRVMLEPHGRRWVFALDMPQEWPADLDIRMESHYQLVRIPGRIHSRFDYQLTSHTRYRAMEPLTDRQKELYLRLPEGTNPRSQALARRWRAENSDPRTIIGKALEIFRADRFYYTLTPPPLGAHAADDFLFLTREGFCEHYSSAFTVLMRAAGIPARVVTGYQGGELNPMGEYFIIRQSDAHAWTEVWIEEEGWVRVDPTAAVAPDRIRFGRSGAALGGDRVTGSAFQRLPGIRSMVLAWDALNTYWNDWVLGYGPDLQNALLRALGVARPHWTKLVSLAVVTMAFLLLGLTVYLAWTHRGARHRDPAARCFARFCRKIKRMKVPSRRPGEGPVDFGHRAAAALPSASEEIDQIVATYVRARYEPDREGIQLRRLRELVRGFKPATVI
jgi:transglutaminase-like putative cysteine protease